jgi:HD-GYP domain-containing protein (c-di-GMP phosphodiesterase class II)
MQLYDDSMARQAHCVAALAAAIASELALGAEEIERCLFAGYLHDIGSLGISREILDKPGPLTTPEWETVRSHAECGGELLLRIPELTGLARAVRGHHERFDGHGYPDRLRGERIPIAARIVGAADAFYALISPRPYREPVAYQGALRIIEDGRGGHWDPEVVDALLERVRADSAAYVIAASA